MLKSYNKDIKNMTIVVSGSGNVAIYAAEKAQQLGAKVVTMSDSSGYIYDPDGIKLDAIKLIKENRRGRIKEYLKLVPTAEFHPDKKVWEVKCDVALPCAIQRELLLEDAIKLVENGCFAVAEGANMPTTLDATEYLQKNGVIFLPGKASNAGGVAVSTIEMSQNSTRTKKSFDEVDNQLYEIMKNIWAQISSAAKDYGIDDNYVAGANIAGFRRVVKAMREQGWV